MESGAAGLVDGYRLTMWVAATLAALSSLTAALTITPRAAPHSGV
jgi:hypothetical protein